MTTEKTETATLLDSTRFPRAYPLAAARLLSSNTGTILADVGRWRVLAAVERILYESPELFRIEADAMGDAARFLILSTPGSDWFDVRDFNDCQDALDIIGMEPTDADHRAALGRLGQGYHPLWRLAFEGGDVINAKPGDFPHWRGLEWPRMVWCDHDLRDAYGYHLPREGAYVWVWPISRRIEVEDVQQRGLTVSPEYRRMIEEVWFA